MRVVGECFFWYRLTRVFPDKFHRAVKRLCVLCVPSVLWHCWLGGRKSKWPVKTEWWDAGVVMCLGQGADLHMTQLMPLPLTTFMVPATRVFPDKIQEGRKTVVCVCCVSLRTSQETVWEQHPKMTCFVSSGTLNIYSINHLHSPHGIAVLTVAP